jgi:hypothetical protein
MGLILLLALQTVLALAGFVYLWRRIDRMSGEIAQLRRALGAARPAARRTRRAQAGEVTPIGDDAEFELADATPLVADAPLDRAARAWGLQSEGVAQPLKNLALAPETLRGLVLALMATAPAFAFFFGADASLIVASGLTMAAAMMLVALRPMWRAAAWAAVLTAGAWALLGFALGAAHADAMGYSVCVAIAGAAGLAHAHLQRATPGATMALTMSAAALALASQTGMVGPAGAAFGAIVALAAMIGAMSLRLEAMHLAAFGAAVIGLFVLSGQDSAAIWFTPAAAWAGALFLGIAVVRVPQLGARGLALAGTGAFGPFGAIAALHAAEHGLAAPAHAATAFLALAAALAGIIAATALRRARGLAALRFTLWMLMLGAFVAAACAIVIGLPAALVSAAFAAVALGLAALNLRLPDAAWRTFAVTAGLFALAFAAVSARLLLSESGSWAAWAIVLAAFVLPSALAGAAAFIATRSKATATAGLFEAIAIVLAVAAANLILRLAFSGGATLLQPIGFVEASAHCAIWLIAALVIGSRADAGAKAVRLAAVNTLGILALAGMALASALWMTPYWTVRGADAAPLSRETLGFLMPGMLFWAHWVFWRARGADLQTRLALGAGALLLAAFLTLEAMRAEALPEWAAAMAGAISFALALGINFARGVTNLDAPRRSHLEEDLKRNRRRQQRGQPR